jgi:hypothetical protein
LSRDIRSHWRRGHLAVNTLRSRVERRRQRLQVDALAVLLVLARFLILPTTHGKGHRTEPHRRDDLTTVDTVSACARVEAAHNIRTTSG